MDPPLRSGLTIVEFDKMFDRCDMNHELHIQYDALDINTLYLDTIREPALSNYDNSLSSICQTLRIFRKDSIVFHLILHYRPGMSRIANIGYNLI